MLGAASLLTLVTVAGLAAGFGREWLLVVHWGAGARTDAFLVVMFLPEAVRSMLSAGLLTSAALPLWQQLRRGGHADAVPATPSSGARSASPTTATPTAPTTGATTGAATPSAGLLDDADSSSSEAARAWLGGLTAALLGLGVLAAAALAAAAPACVRLIGPGLDAVHHDTAVAALRVLAWSLPGQLLHALWCLPQQARGRFALAGAGSLLYNLPALLWLVWQGAAVTEGGLAAAYVLGSLAMAASMARGVWRAGVRARHLRPRGAALADLGRRLAPLLASALAGQGLLLLERIVASYLGAGVLTLLNLARKLFNLPAVALMSLNQVLLGLMSRQPGAAQIGLLTRGLALSTLVTVPAALGLMVGGRALTGLLFARVDGAAPLAELLAGYAPVLVVTGWATMLARYSYAQGDTGTPLRCELGGQGVQALVMPLLAGLLGAQGLVQAMFVGGALTTVLLLRRLALTARVGLEAQAGVAALLLAACAATRPWASPLLPWWQLGVAVAIGTASLLALAVWLKPWRAPAAAS